MNDGDTLAVVRHVALASEPAPDGSGPLLEDIGEATIVLIGEASHGTHEFYRTRAELTKALIERSAVDETADLPETYPSTL